MTEENRQDGPEKGEKVCEKGFGVRLGV